jgi:hypothetical protein
MERKDSSEINRDSDPELQMEKAKHVETIYPAQTQQDISEELDRIVTRKFDKHIVPWLFGIW